MGFLTPWFLAGFAAIGLPVWLHLLKRHRSTPLPFSSLMFFERRIQSSIQHRRLQYLLLLALRCALILLLALAFANPFIQTSSTAVAQGRKLLVLAIDNSFSMRQGDRLERAKDAALSTLGSLRHEDRAQVLAFGSQVRMMSDSTADVPALRAAIQAVEPTDERGSYAELARAVRAMAQAARVPVEVHLFSDMQKSALPPNFADLRLAEGVRLATHAVAAARVANVAVESVNVPRRVYGAGKVRLLATLAGFGNQRATRRVSLVLNGRQMDSKAVEVAPDGRASVEFPSLEVPFGLNRGEVRLDGGDAFPDDDVFYFSVERAEPRGILFVRDAAKDGGLLYFRTALDAGGESAFRLEAVDVAQASNLPLDRYAFVVLSDIGGLPGRLESALREYVRAGGSLLISLGRASAARGRVPVLDENIVETRYSGREADGFQTAAWLDSGHPSIGQANHWDDVKFYQTVRVQPGQARVAARLSDDTPLLLDRGYGEGRVLVFASTFDNIANDFPLHAAFVPFIEQTAAYLGRIDERQGNFLVGSFLELRKTREQGATVEVLDPKGRRLLSLAESTKTRNIQFAGAGFYDVHQANGRHDLAAVNADRHESDLDIIPAETLALWQNTAKPASAEAGVVEAETRPFPFWWYIMAALLAVAVAESLLGNRHLSVKKEAA